MVLNTEQKDFLQRLNKKAVSRVAENNQQQIRDSLLEKLQNQIGDKVDRLKGIHEKLEVKNEKGETQQVLNYQVRDQETEFDIDEQYYEGYRLVEDDDSEGVDQNFLMHLEAAHIVTDMSRELETEITVQVPDLDTNGDPQFGPSGELITKTVTKKLFEGEDLKKALGSELYQPLVREGLMPETFVPDEFSETKEMLDGSFKAYKERLEREGLNNKIFSPENLAMAQTLFSSTVSMFGSANSINDAKGVEAKDIKPSELKPSVKFFTDDLNKDRKMAAIADMTNMTFDLLMTGKDVYDEFEGSEESSAGASMGKIAVAIANVVGVTLGAELQDPAIPKTVPVALSTVFNKKTNNANVAKGLIKALEDKGEAGITDAAREMGTGLDKAFDEAGLTNDKVPHDCAGGMAGIDALGVATDLREKNYDRVLNAFKKQVENTLSSVKTSAKSYLQTHGAQVDKDLSKKITEELSASIDKDAEESKRELAAIDNEKDMEKRASLIEKKIQELERSMKAIDWSIKLSKMAFDVAAKFIGPLAIGGSLIKLIENTAKATARACDAAQFLDSRQDMLRAASPYSSAVANFVHNSRVQAAHYSVNAALDGLNMAGAIVETLGYASGPGALAGVVAGKIMQAAANIGQAIEAVLYEIGKRVDLEKAWKFYRQALSRPENRKMGLKALHNNPTLAKYATAWGAVVKHDVLVTDFIRKTGLTAESLRDPKAEVDQVVKYLELRMPDDNVVTGRLGGPEWEPGKIELTVACFIGAKTKAVKSDKLQDDSTRDIEKALASFESQGASIYAEAQKYDKDSIKTSMVGKELAPGGLIWIQKKLYKNSKSEKVVLTVDNKGVPTADGIDLVMDASKLEEIRLALSASFRNYSPLNNKKEPHIDFKRFCSQLEQMVYDVQKTYSL